MCWRSGGPAGERRYRKQCCPTWASSRLYAEVSGFIGTDKLGSLRLSVLRTDGRQAVETAVPRYWLLFGLAGGLAAARSDIRMPYEILLAVARFLFTVRTAVRPAVKCFADRPS